MAVLKMGTRGSALALAQSSWAARALEALHPGLKVETVVVKTRGDLFGAPPPEEAKKLPQGAKGLWVKELEEAVLAGRVDFAVHSAKDLPASLAPGLEIAAYPEREDPRDALVALGGLGLDALPRGAVVATSSLRRRLMLVEKRPDLVFKAVRGNVDTRLKKLEAGEFDALVLAEAGLKRLGLDAVGRRPLDPSMLIPAPGQAALALETASSRPELVALVSALDHASTRLCVEAERAFLAAVEGGCGSPVAAHAKLRDGGLALEAFWAAEGAAAGRRVDGVCEDAARGPSFAAELAARAKAA